VSKLWSAVRRALTGILLILISVLVGGAAVTQSVHPPDPPWWDIQNWIAWFHRDPQNAAILLVGALGSGGGFALAVFQAWFSRAATEAENRSMARIEMLEQSLSTRIGSVHKTQEELVGAVQGISGQVAKQVIDVLTERHYRLESDRKEGVRLSRSLPPRPPRCIGRTQDIERLTSHLIEGHPSTALIAFGGPGVGKSALISEVAHHPRIRSRYGDRILFVQLEKITNTEELLTFVANVLDQPRRNSLGEMMAEQGTEPSLLILDNCESLWQSDPAACEALMQSLGQLAPSTALAVTFRGTDIPGGIHWTLRHPVLPLTDNYDRALFLEIAPKIAQDDPRLPTLLAELGGVPLAIELVALEAAPFDRLESVWTRWQQVGTSLANRRRFAADRTTSLDYSIELSLNSPSRHPATPGALAAIAFFHNGLDEVIAEKVLGQDFYEAVRDLIGCGLGMRSNNRIDILPPVRRYVLDHYPIWEPLVGQLVVAYYSMFQNLIRADGDVWPALNAAVVAEAENLQVIYIYACTRMEWMELLDQSQKVMEYYKTMQGSFGQLASGSSATAHIRFLKAYDLPLEYAGFMSIQSRSYKPLTRAVTVRVGLERLVRDMMRIAVYRELDQMDEILLTCPPEVQEDTAPKLAKLRRIYEDHFQKIRSDREESLASRASNPLSEMLDPFSDGWAGRLDELCRDHGELVRQAEELMFAAPPADGAFFHQKNIDFIMQRAPQPS
jgi:hypothetical protein